MIKQEEMYIGDKHLLIVDDEPALLTMLSSILQAEGFTHLTLLENSLDAYRYCDDSIAKKIPVHMLILDVMMPGMDGFSLLEKIRGIPGFETIPAIFLTAKDEAFSRLSGLGLGADDYLAKPFLPQELVLRIKAVLRRCYKEENPLLKLAFTEVDLATAEVYREGEVIMLTAKEHEIVSVLARNAGRIVTSDAICESCWGDTFGYENTLMAHIRRLREKIERDPSKPQSLVTVKGLGYRLQVKG